MFVCSFSVTLVTILASVGRSSSKYERHSARDSAVELRPTKDYEPVDNTKGETENINGNNRPHSELYEVPSGKEVINQRLILILIKNNM